MSRRAREALQPAGYRPIPAQRAVQPAHSFAARRDARDSSGRATTGATRASGAPRLGHDFGKMRVLPAAAVHDQSPAPSGTPTEDQASAPPAAPAPEPAKAEPAKPAAPREESKGSSSTPVVDSVDLISSPSGAVGGFPEDKNQPGASLNAPDAYNDTWITGAVANIHQVHFHLAKGWPANLRAARVADRKSVRRGYNIDWAGHDGPPLYEYQFTKDKMVIADAPGWYKTLKEIDFPVTYKADFSLYAFDPLDYRIVASISYQVNIEKTHYTQHDPVNTVKVTGKKIGGPVPAPVKPEQFQPKPK
jgi:hypothetical protein